MKDRKVSTNNMHIFLNVTLYLARDIFLLCLESISPEVGNLIHFESSIKLLSFLSAGSDKLFD